MKCFEVTNNIENGWKGMEMGKNGMKGLEMTKKNASKDRHGRKLMELAENALKCLDMARKCKEWPTAVQLVYNT